MIAVFTGIQPAPQSGHEYVPAPSVETHTPDRKIASQKLHQIEFAPMIRPRFHPYVLGNTEGFQ